MAKTRSYESDDIVVHFDVRRCIHSEECVKGLPSVFDVDKKPWVDPEAADADEIAEVIHRCPTGALTYDRKDGGPSEPWPEGPPEIRVERDGPLFVRGTVSVERPDGSAVELESPRLALCRCGASKNKPFCDNTHLEIDFSDD